jgi:hypothetical protein
MLFDGWALERDAADKEIKAWVQGFPQSGGVWDRGRALAALEPAAGKAKRSGRGGAAKGGNAAGKASRGGRGGAAIGGGAGASGSAGSR